jgi:hypothetical protein
MTYSRSMAIRIALVVVPAIVAVGLVFLLDSTNASAEITVAAFTVVAAAIGAAIGCFADRLPGARPRRDAHPASHRSGN